MNIKPIASPHAMQPPQGQQGQQQSAREKAIAALMGSQAPQGQTPVPDANNISVEEMGAVNKDVSQKDGIEQLVASEEPKTPEIPKVEETPAEDPALKRQFEELSRKERSLRAQAQKQEQAIKLREEAIKVREAELAAKDEQYKSGYIPKTRLTEETLSVLAEAGISYDQIAEQYINQTPVNPQMQAHIAKLEARIEELSQKTDASEKSYKQQQSDAYQAAVKQVKMDVTALVNSNPEFETIKATGSIQDVVDLITQTYEQDGLLLTVEEAAQEVENYMLEETIKLTNIDKVKKRLAAANSANTASKTPTEQTPVASAKQSQHPTMKTLTNSTSTQRPINARDRALAAFKGEKL